MRTITYIFLSIVFFTLKAQNSTYESAILKGKKLLKEAEGPDGYQSAANFFERVAQKETEEWLPLYYQAQILAFQASNDSIAEKKEAYLNNALELISKAKKMDKNSELVALEGFVQMLRLTVDPATRGQTLSPTIFGLFNQALAMDAENPRALLFLGQMHYGTAQFFGSGFDEACTYIQKAYDAFEKLPAEETIYPTWGRGAAEAAKQKCS